MKACGGSKHSGNGEAYLFSSFQHARHCFCAYGVRINSRPFHWKMNSLSLRISIPNTVCSEWSDIDTALTAKDAQRLFSLERFFFSVAFQRWVEEGHSKCATDSATATLQDESSEAQNRQESDVMSVTINNSLSRLKLGNDKRPARNEPKKQVYRCDSQHQEAKEIRRKSCRLLRR